MNTSVERTLRHRVAELDAAHPWFDSDLDHFADVMSEHTDTRAAAECGDGVGDPEAADRIVGGCRLLDVIAERDADLVAGPLCLSRQHWTGTGREDVAPEPRLTPSKALFVPPETAQGDLLSAKPFDVGLFTSTCASEGRSMWRAYLDGYLGSDLFPLPWRTWHLRPGGGGIRVREITDAKSWVEFVAEYPRGDGGIVYPDWRRVGRDFAGVHMTLRAIAATQGLCFPVSGGLTAAPYWDVESTLWLRWVFGGDAVLQEVVEEE
ncbi:hypothetical protein LO762_29600 [Actinocorallia sp. API 0066]|uniref:hypothetical protein n=1 Tax=Actinocorallia sp. API 0066 TaxID=2896846 RepID=UPI001E469069|nr:hypothetical protein [Actinocorallia sp. API 0066]MCD0453306.1 hypothetical protein [Actinocorallia sp. API 0066]